jgi:hypothetical protein
VALVEPRGQLYPAVQAPLHDESGSPGIDPYTPAGQREHDEAPAVLYVPCRQMDAVEIVDPAAQLYPGVHSPEQLTDCSPEVSPYNPAGHSAVHRELFMPGDSPYCPDEQLLHEGAPPKLYVPGRHSSTKGVVAPAGQL